jgi:hypothetical protein
MVAFSDGMIGAEQVYFEMVVCCKEGCHIPFMITTKHRAKLMETGDWFYCPNGHSQHYSPTELSKAKKEIERLKSEQEETVNWANRIQADKWKLEKQIADSKKTECPHCKKKYLNIDRHIKRQHARK